MPLKKFLDKYYPLLFLAVLIRLLLIFLPGFKIDVDDWFAWAVRLSQVGLAKFYSNQYFSDYTPGYMYVLNFLGLVKDYFQIADRNFYIILKLPAVLAEITLTIFVFFKIIKDSAPFYKVSALILLIFNPALIFNSSIWGQVDSILSSLLLLSVYYLNKKSLVFSSILLGFSFLVKPQTIAILPLFALYLIKDFSLEKLFKMLFLFFIVIFLLSLPFFPNQGYRLFFELVNIVAKAANEYTYTSLFAYNTWGAVGFWINDQKIWMNLSYQVWGQLLLIIYWVIISYLFLKNKLSIYSTASLATLGFFFLPTRVHERYLYPALVFLVITAFKLKSRFLYLSTALMSLIHLLNLYYVYIYYNVFYYKIPSVLYKPVIYNLLDQNGQNLSILSTILFIFTSVIIIKLSYVNKIAEL